MQFPDGTSGTRVTVLNFNNKEQASAFGYSLEGPLQVAIFNYQNGGWGMDSAEDICKH